MMKAWAVVAEAAAAVVGKMKKSSEVIRMEKDDSVLKIYEKDLSKTYGDLFQLIGVGLVANSFLDKPLYKIVGASVFLLGKGMESYALRKIVTAIEKRENELENRISKSEK